MTSPPSTPSQSAGASHDALVSRLRATQRALGYTLFANLGNEAADAIERLERELQEARAECERLKRSAIIPNAAVADMQRGYQAALTETRQEAATLLSECETLRAELQEALAQVELQEARRGGIGLIAAERQRQVEAEGWTPEHDDEHTDGSLANAAACYALTTPKMYRMPPDIDNPDPAVGHVLVPAYWPWNPKWWKPRDRIRNLVRAGALIAAEIDRLKRAALRDGDK